MIYLVVLNFLVSQLQSCLLDDRLNVGLSFLFLKLNSLVDKSSKSYLTLDDGFRGNKS